jgi:hypothetical protein
VLEAVPPHRRSELGLDEEHSIESLLESHPAAGYLSPTKPIVPRDVP